MNESLQAILELSLNYIILTIACVYVLHPRLKPGITILICTVVLLGSVGLSWPFSSGSLGRLVPSIAALLLVFCFFADPLVIKITAFCQAATLAVLIDAISWLVGALVFQVPVSALLCETPDIQSTVAISVRAINIGFLVVFSIIWVRSWDRIIRPLPANALNALLALLSIQPLAQGYVVSSIVVSSSTEPMALPLCLFLIGLSIVGLLLLFVSFYFFGLDAGEDANRVAMQSAIELQRRYLTDLQAYARSLLDLRANAEESLETMRHMISRADDEAFFQFVGATAETARQHPVSYSGSIAASSLLSAKATICQEKGIRFAVKTRIEARFMSEFDICTILSNLMDNAIRAASAMPEGERWIALSMVQRAGVSVLVCRNTYDPQSKKRHNPIEHGTGLYIVRSIASHYDGTMGVRYEQSTFTVTISFFGATGT